MIPRNWFSQCWKIRSYIILLVICFLLEVSESSTAQVVPDNTLGNESSVVTPNIQIQGVESDLIDGGAIRGTNLFHSFEQFNIGAGRGVYFANPVGIDNILSRVTGANPSEILGRLGVLGDANLFLINPRGIVFGPASSLDVQGSFLATTANAVRLGDVGLFSASQPATSNLLSVRPSAFWFNAVAAQPIVNRSRSESVFNQPNSLGLAPGLQVRPVYPEGGTASQRTLALIGGNVLLERSRLTAAGGRIELGSVTGIGNVSLTQNGNRFVLGYDSIQNFGALRSSSPFGVIALSNGAFVDASGEGGGDIQVRGARLDLAQGSNLRANTLGAGNGGQVLIRTTETTLSEGSVLSADVTPTGTGIGGDLTISTERLQVRDGSRVSTGLSNRGKGGNLQITASDSVEVSGRSITGRFGSAVSTTSTGNGDAGNLRIDTERLLIQGGAQVSAAAFGAGKGGNLQITASDLVEVRGRSDNGQFGSAVFTTSAGSGDAGELKITTRQLRVQGGAQVAAGAQGTGKGSSLQITASDSVEVLGTSANGQVPSGLFTAGVRTGDSGNIRIDTGRLIVRDGAQIAAGTQGTGRGSSLQITASDSVEVSGIASSGLAPSGLFTQAEGSGDAGNLSIDTRRLLVQGGGLISASTLGRGQGGSLQITASDSVDLIGQSADGQFFSALFTISLGSGNAGELKIGTGRLLVRDRATISSRSEAAGTAGNINITTRTTLQAENGTISTNASRAAGGEIAIEAGTIRLFGDSDIRSNVASGDNNGGNITLKASSVLAFNDSDIFAFARDGRGGDITLNTPAFFGENYRPAPDGTDLDTLNNNNRVDINATGAISGIITLPDVSFIQNSLAELPDDQIDTDTLLANSCIVRRTQVAQGSFTVTGTGGLPQRPGDTQMSSFPTVSVEMLPDTKPTSNQVWQKGDAIVEPQGFYRLSNGKLVLSRNCF